MIQIVRKEVRDALRSRWLIAYAVALALLGLAAAVAGTRSASGLDLQAFGRTTATLTNLCLLLAPLVALVMGALSIAGERDRGTLDHLLAQPIERWELLVGKYLGLLVALAAASAAGFVPAGVALAFASGPSALPRLVPFVLLASLLVASMLAVGILVSVKSSGGVQALGLAIVAWFLLVLLYDLVLVGALWSGGLGAGSLAVLLVANPVDAARVLVVLALEPDLYLLGPAGALMVETLSIRGTAAVLLAALLAWTLVPLAAAVVSFRLPARPRPASRREPAGACRRPERSDDGAGLERPWAPRSVEVTWCEAHGTPAPGGDER